MIDLSGKAALITGSSRGIGRGCALEMARAGADICVNYRSHGDEAEAVAEEVRAMGRRALVCRADVAEREAVDGRCDAAVTRAMGAAARLPPSDAGYSLEPPRLRDRERHGGQYVTSAHVPDPVMEVFLEDGNLVTGGWPL